MKDRFLPASLILFVLGACAFLPAFLPAFSQASSPACLKDNDPTRLFNCAKSLQAAGRVAQAVQVMTKAVSKNPTAANWKLLSDLSNNVARGPHKLEVRAFSDHKIALSLVQVFTVK
jgi:hypothetical protein